MYAWEYCNETHCFVQWICANKNQHDNDAIAILKQRSWVLLLKSHRKTWTGFVSLKNASLTKIHIKKTIKNDRGTVPGLSTSCLPGGLEFSSQHSVRQLTTTCSSSSLAPRSPLLPSSSSCTDQLQVTLAFCHNGLLYRGHSIGMVLHLNKWSQCDRLRVSSFT